MYWMSYQLSTKYKSMTTITIKYRFIGFLKYLSYILFMSCELVCTYSRVKSEIFAL